MEERWRDSIPIGAIAIRIPTVYGVFQIPSLVAFAGA
jgi:hypothetical protein